MKYSGYLRDKLPAILINILSMLGSGIFLSAVNLDGGIVFILLSFWILILIIYISSGYYFRKRYFRELQSQLDGLDKKYLLAEVMDRPQRSDDRAYYRIIKAMNKSMLEHVSDSIRERKEYREYIEQWIHDVKTPISAMRLVCENNRSDVTRRLTAELEKMDRFTEQALYYARSENVEKDYFIKEVDISDIIHNAIARNKQLLILNQVSVHIEDCGAAVYTDEKWVGFIIDQLIYNAVKYGSADPAIIFETRICQNSVILSLHDNGIGISGSDLPRIFEKGFTGENGRSGRSSTGIGLYLCKRLCDKLGIGISAASEQGRGTTVELNFPKGDYIKMHV